MATGGHRDGEKDGGSACFRAGCWSLGKAAAARHTWHHQRPRTHGLQVAARHLQHCVDAAGRHRHQQRVLLHRPDPHVTLLLLLPLGLCRLGRRRRRSAKALTKWARLLLLQGPQVQRGQRVLSGGEEQVRPPGALAAQRE